MHRDLTRRTLLKASAAFSLPVAASPSLLKWLGPRPARLHQGLLMQQEKKAR
jgi:hypothetical protein